MSPWSPWSESPELDRQLRTQLTVDEITLKRTWQGIEERLQSPLASSHPPRKTRWLTWGAIAALLVVGVSIFMILEKPSQASGEFEILTDLSMSSNYDDIAPLSLLIDNSDIIAWGEVTDVQPTRARFRVIDLLKAPDSFTSSSLAPQIPQRWLAPELTWTKKERCYLFLSRDRETQELQLIQGERAKLSSLPLALDNGSLGTLISQRRLPAAHILSLLEDHGLEVLSQLPWELQGFAPIETEEEIQRWLAQSLSRLSLGEGTRLAALLKFLSDNALGQLPSPSQEMIHRIYQHLAQSNTSLDTRRTILEQLSHSPPPWFQEAVLEFLQVAESQLPPKDKRRSIDYRKQFATLRLAEPYASELVRTKAWVLYQTLPIRGLSPIQALVWLHPIDSEGTARKTEELFRNPNESVLNHLELLLLSQTRSGIDRLESILSAPDFVAPPLSFETFLNRLAKVEDPVVLRRLRSSARAGFQRFDSYRSWFRFVMLTEPDNRVLADTIEAFFASPNAGLVSKTKALHLLEERLGKSYLEWVEPTAEEIEEACTRLLDDMRHSGTND